LILGFFLIGLLAIAGSIALADSFVQQRDLQDVCDGAAAAAAATAIDLRRGAVAESDTDAEFADTAEIERAVDLYLARDPDRRRVQVSAALTADRRTLTLRCTRTQPLAFGAVFALPSVTHAAISSARARLRD
jgi:hypothetical protein